MTSTPSAQPAGARIPKPPLHRVGLSQLAILLPVASLLLLVDKDLAGSALLGGLTGILPQAWYAWYAFRESGAQATARVMGRLFRGEATKVGLTALGCAASFRFYREAQPVAFFLSLVLMMVLGWCVTARVATAKTPQAR